MRKFNFREIFGWLCWITLGILAVWAAGMLVIDVLALGTRNVGILMIFLSLTLFTFAVDSLMEDNPELIRKYFIQWVIVCGILIFFALTIYVWHPFG